MSFVVALFEMAASDEYFPKEIIVNVHHVRY